jgi:hypothetical protein
MNNGCSHSKDWKVRGEWTETVHCRIMSCDNYSEKCALHAIASLRRDKGCNFVDPNTLRFDRVLTELSLEWTAQSIDPDAMLKCALHKQLMFDPNKNFEPTWHYMHKGMPVGVVDEDDLTLTKYKAVDDNGLQQGEPLMLTQKDVKGMLCQLPDGWGLEEIR